MNILLLFLDGVGIGKPDESVNPLFRASMPTLHSLLGGIPHSRYKSGSTSKAVFGPANTTLGIEGLPQSGTGQTAIFTGINAPRKIGRHFGPFPTTDLRPDIEERNIFRQLTNLGKTVTFANAFPKQFFEYTSSGTRRLSVTTLSCMMTGIPLQTIDSLVKNEAVSADLTRERWPELGYPDLPVVTADEAGKHLAAIASKHDFTLFEYWLTDHAGHSRDARFAVDILERFDLFLHGLIEDTNLKKTLIVLISDHGNIEDLSTKGHTRNPVPCIAIGPGRKEFVTKIKNLTHITPTIVRFLTS